MKLTETAPVRFALDIAPKTDAHSLADLRKWCRTGGVAKCLADLRFTADLRSPGFDISDTRSALTSDPANHKRFQWDWLISPKKLGHHGVSLVLYPPFDVVTRSLSRAQLKWRYDDVLAGDHQQADFSGPADFYVDVVDDLGLTPRQETLAKSLAGLVALLATAFSFPFIKIRWEKKQQP